VIGLGISYQMHDSAACLVRDGEVVAAVAEERLSRLKHDSRFPRLSIAACLEMGGVRADDLDYVAFAWPEAYESYLHDLKDLALHRTPASARSALDTTRHFISMHRRKGGLREFLSTFGGRRARVHRVGHHLSHAVSAYARSGFEDAAVVVMDGRGAREATTVWIGRDGRLDPVLSIPFPQSLGLFYAEMTYYLGFEKYSDEWKVMGLAPYGGPGIDISGIIDVDAEPYRVNAHALLGKSWDDVTRIERVLGRRRVPESELDDRHRAIAFAVQEACERAMLHVVELAVRRTGCRRVCLAGGVALNSKANGAILRSGLVDDLFIQPAAADDGASIGAALFPYYQGNGAPDPTAMRHTFLGPSYEDEIETTLSTYRLRFQRVASPARTAASLIDQGRVVGWVQGRMEFGPRALGGRSILADPRDAGMKDRVNAAVKFREAWRPFAPSILAEHAGGWMQDARESPFMILTFGVRPEHRDDLAAVTHVDGTLRPQTVDRDVDPLYWELIDEFRKLSGVPAVMNTSFNLRGEPIVCSPTDAIRTFYSSGLDVLILGTYLLEK
jgi:carbamoyltransferase